MTSRTSFYNATILKKNLARFWPFMALCAFIGFLLLPASMEAHDNYSVVGSIGTQVAHILPLLIVGYATVCAVCVFGYLHKSRSSNMLHALPLTRSSLFVSNLLSGFLLFLLPWFVICLISLFILAGNGLDVCIVLSIFAVGIMEFLFFYALAVFCMFLCGKTAYGVLTYLFLNVVVFYTEMLVWAAVEPFLFGINVEWGTLSEFSPIVYFMEHTAWGVNDKISFYANFPDVNLYCDWGYLGILSAVGIVLLALAWLLYRKRNMENVGEMVAYPYLRPVFRIVLAFFSALALGLLITAVLFPEGVSQNTAIGMHLAMLIGGFIGYFGVEMILRKTTRVFQGKTFLRYGLFAVALSLMLFAVRFDWLNIVGYVPNECKRVTLRYTPGPYDSHDSFVLSDSESIDTIRTLHQKIVDNRDTARTYRSYSDACPDYHVEFIYELEDGDTVKRSYIISGNTAIAAQQEIFKDFSNFIHSNQATLGFIRSLKVSDTCEILAVQHETGTGYILDKKHFSALCEAMERDATEGLLDIASFQRVGTTTDRIRPKDGYLIGCGTYHRTGSEDCYFPYIFIPNTATNSYSLLTELLEKPQQP